APHPGQAEKAKPQGNQPLPNPQLKPEAERTIEVRGQVLDPDGKPVAGAKLYLGPSRSKDRKYPVRATSGNDGRFTFNFSRSELDQSDSENIPGQVMAVAEGLGCDWAEVGPAGEALTLRLVKDVPIRGRIFDPDGQPVAGAKVTVVGVSAAKGEDL